MRILIAVTTCHMFRDRADACRRTWVKDAIEQGFEVKFFLGTPTEKREPLPDEVFLDCPDGYHYLTKKTQLLRRWALDNGFDYVWKVDDDAYIRAERLVPLSGPDYIGRLRGPSGLYPSPYCSGFCYGLSRRSLEILAGCEWKDSDDICEDRWTANRLLPAGISPTLEPWFVITHSKKSALNGHEPPLQDNRVIAACEYTPEMMDQVHANFVNGAKSKIKKYRKPAGSLSRVAVMVKTFLRDGYLLACLKGIEETMSDATIVVVDDGREDRRKITKYAEMRDRDDLVIWLPFDAGFGEKANVAVEHILKHRPDVEYVLIASDDFEFTPQVRTSVENMQKVLDANPNIAVASGRVNGNPYEFSWEMLDGGTTIKEVPKYYGSGEIGDVKFHMCDLTVNFSLIRMSIFRDGIRWDGGDVKIGGGEHSAFFIDLQRSYHSVCYVEGANIREFKFNPHWMQVDYPKMRARARKPGRACLKKRGIDKYILANGVEELS
jgi:Glycosyl transferase family 2/Galactosyltransferase